MIAIFEHIPRRDCMKEIRNNIISNEIKAIGIILYSNQIDKFIDEIKTIINYEYQYYDKKPILKISKRKISINNTTIYFIMESNYPINTRGRSFDIIYSDNEEIRAYKYIKYTIPSYSPKKIKVMIPSINDGYFI